MHRPELSIWGGYREISKFSRGVSYVRRLSPRCAGTPARGFRCARRSAAGGRRGRRSKRRRARRARRGPRLPLPCSVSASISGAKGPAERSENSPSRRGPPLLGLRLGERSEGTGRGLGELGEALACPFPAQSPLRLAGRRDRPRARRIHRGSRLPLPCSPSASESGAKGPTEGSESSPRPSLAPSLLRLRFGDLGEATGGGLGEFIESPRPSPAPSLLPLRLGERGESTGRGLGEFTEAPRPAPSCSVGEREEKNLEAGPFARSEGLAAASRSSDVPSAVSGVTADARSYSMEQFGQRQSSELLGLHRSHLGRNDV